MDQPLVEKEHAGGRRPAYILGAVLLFMFVSGVFFHDAIENSIHEALVFTAGLGNWAAFFIFLLTAMLNLFMLPTFPIMIGAGVVCTNQYHDPNVGGLVGTLAVFSGLWLGSMVAFMLGRHCLKDFAKRELESHKILQVVNGMIAESGWKIVLLARMSPLLPAEVFNYACSLVETLTPAQYALGCTGSIVPVSFWVFSSARAADIAQGAGNGTATDAPQGGSTLIALNLVIIVALSVAFYVAYDRYKKKTEETMHNLQTVRRYFAKRAVQRPSGPSLRHSQTAPDRVLTDEPGVCFHSETDTNKRCSSEKFVKWGDEVFGKAVKISAGGMHWIEVLTEDGTPTKSGEPSQYLPLMCEHESRHGMCLEDCSHRHRLLTVTIEDGLQKAHSECIHTPTVHPRYTRSFAEA